MPETSRSCDVSFSAIVLVLALAACDGRGRDVVPDSAVPDERPPVALLGTWVQLRPTAGDTLIVKPGGVADGQPMPLPHFGRTTRWSVSIGMFCVGDSVGMSCRGVHRGGDTLYFADGVHTTYVRAP